MTVNTAPAIRILILTKRRVQKLNNNGGWSGIPSEHFKRSRELRNATTPPEQKLWQYLRGLFTRDELKAVAKAAKEAGAKEIHCLAWEFEMDLRLVCHEIEHADNVKIKLIPIPREIMEKNRINPPPFLEVAVLEAEVVYKTPPHPPLSKGGV